MAEAIGGLLPGSSSSASRTSARARLLEASALATLGAIAVVAHAATRRQIDLPPGHEGVVWMALVLVGRLTSRSRWAGATAAVGAAAVSMLPVWGFGDSFRWAEYLLTGVTLDVGYMAFTRWQSRLWFLALLGGVAFATKPLLRADISAVTGVPFGSLLLGVGYPTLTHFVFGLIGAGIGSAAVIGYRSYRSAGAPSQ